MVLARSPVTFSELQMTVVNLPIPALTTDPVSAGHFAHAHKSLPLCPQEYGTQVFKALSDVFIVCKGPNSTKWPILLRVQSVLSVAMVSPSETC